MRADFVTTLRSDPIKPDRLGTLFHHLIRDSALPRVRVRIPAHSRRCSSFAAAQERGPHSLPERGPSFSYRGLPSLAVLMVLVATLVGVVLLVTVVLTVMLVVTPVLPALTPVMSVVVVPVAAIENLGNLH
jgi:hypothetical protein